MRTRKDVIPSMKMLKEINVFFLSECVYICDFVKGDGSNLLVNKIL